MDGGTLLRIIAVLIGLRALTNVFKPFGAGSGLVFFGTLLTGAANAILAPLLGVYMLIYVYGLWTLRRFAWPMGLAYAVLVTCNMLFFPFVQGLPANIGVLAYFGFAAVGLAGAWGAVWLLSQRRAALR